MKLLTPIQNLSNLFSSIVLSKVYLVILANTNPNISK